MEKETHDLCSDQMAYNGQASAHHSPTLCKASKYIPVLGLSLAIPSFQKALLLDV